MVSIGRVRMRLAVAAKIAFVTAGATTAVGASPKPPGGLGAFDQMCFDHRRLVDPQRPIGVEIALFDPRILQRDRAVERGGQAEALRICRIVSRLELVCSPYNPSARPICILLENELSGPFWSNSLSVGPYSVFRRT